MEAVREEEVKLWWGTICGELVFESDEQEFSHPGRDVLKSILKVQNARVKVE